MERIKIPAKVEQKVQDFPEWFGGEVEKFFSLDKKDLAKLMDRVSNSHNHVICLMHPLNLHEDEKFKDYFVKSLNRYFKHGVYEQTGFKKEVKQSPIILFTGADDYEKSLRIINSFLTSFLRTAYMELNVSGKEFNFSKSLHDYGIFVAKTEPDKGVPFFGDDVKLEKEYYMRKENKILEYEGREFVMMVNIFDYLGIKSLTLSGGYIGSWKRGGTDLISRCLGKWLRCMRPFFGVDLSNSAVYKDGVSGERLKKSGLPLKDTGKKNL